MERRGLLPFVVTAFFAVMISLFAFSLMDLKDDAPQTQTIPDSQSKRNDSDISNQVKNNIKGNKANVNNSIDNDLNNGEDSQIDNNVTNDIEVNVDVNVTNTIKNKADKNQDSGQTGNGNENSGSDKGAKNDQDSKPEDDEVVWGVDSASLTTSDLLSCVRENFGSPKVWGRYLGEKEGVSAGITPQEAELLQGNDIKLLVIWNRFNDATGLENGQSEAKAAVQLAQELGIPEGVAIFADIEPNYPVDSSFIEGWYQAMEESPYHPGIYGIFDKEQALAKSFSQAAAGNSSLLENTFIWTASPNIGITEQEKAPGYKPEAPENSLIAGWQYGIDAKACNIDTNLFNKDILDVLW
ncbi:glycoside hydrolase domain-containing protein [Cytobacillus firmus]|uniref:glycoside hydrolase domain-containing protein n=1 Tax=Cytobacillus firmus TaxID=1399 RepID=UPI0022281ED8|nr:glycoside hydrolase domain-containing protein [Cytobacillus firmus]